MKQAMRNIFWSLDTLKYSSTFAWRIDILLSNSWIFLPCNNITLAFELFTRTVANVVFLSNGSPFRIFIASRRSMSPPVG